MMDFCSVIVGLLAIIVVLIGLCLWPLFAVFRINRHPDDEYPRSRFNKGEWDE